MDQFYKDGLGLPTEGIVEKEFEHGGVAFYDMQVGLKFAVWSRLEPRMGGEGPNTVYIFEREEFIYKG